MKRAGLSLIFVFCSIAAAQVPASGPSTEPATLSASTQPQGPTTIAVAPASTAPTTAPTTMAVAMPTTTPSTAPTTMAATTMAATTRPVLATTGPTTARVNIGASTRLTVPLTRAVAAPLGPDLTPRPISVDYRVLLSRSIFIRGRQQVVDPGSISDGGRRIYVSDLNPSTTQSTQPSNVPSWSPENTLVFNGASDANGQLIAFIENISLNSIARFRVGDPIASGKVAGITLDQLDYAVGGRVTHVMLGQNLSGVDTQVLTTQPVTATTGPAGLGSSGGADDVLERLRRRRMQELGGK